MSYTRKQIESIEKDFFDDVTRFSSDVSTTVFRQNLLDVLDETLKTIPADEIDWLQVLHDAGYSDYFQQAIDRQEMIRAKAETLWGLTSDSDTIARLDALRDVNMNDFGDLGRKFAESLKDAVKEEALRTGLKDKSPIRQAVGDTGAANSGYMETIRQTAVMSYSSALHVEKGREAGFDHYMYAGQMQETTRPFCRKLLERGDAAYTRNQIDAMSNGMLDPVWVYRGGYRCVHRWILVDPEWDGITLWEG